VTVASGGPQVARDRWRRNIWAVAAASFLGYTGFTLVMPFLSLFIGELGVTDVGRVAMWTGLSLGVTPALTAILAPVWGRLGDRFGRKVMLERSMASFVVSMAATAYASRAWHVLAIRSVQGVFAGYGSLSVAMAAESAPRDRMPQAIGLVQTAQRLGPALGPVIGSALAAFMGLRRGFLATATFYAIGLVVVHFTYDDAAVAHRLDSKNAESAENAENRATPVTFRSVLSFRNFMLMMAVIFGLQFVDRSFGPVLPLYIQQLGYPDSKVAFVSGSLFSIMACTGALGHHFCGRLLRRFPSRFVIVCSAGLASAGCGLLGASANVWVMSVASAVFGLGIGAAMTASYSEAGSVIPVGAHGAGFGVLTSASLVGMAASPFVAGALGGTSIRTVFFVDLALMAMLALAVRLWMQSSPQPPVHSPQSPVPDPQTLEA
jgi:DHA1 family multidrug resistance protein-like MFS transporter